MAKQKNGNSGSNGNKKKNIDISEKFSLLYENQDEINRLNQSLRRISNETREFYMDPIEGDEIIFGVMSNNHAGSIMFDKDATKSFTEYAYKNGARIMLHGGDILDGTRMARSQKYEQYATDFDEQINDMIDAYPRKKGMRTYFICGDHDLSFSGELKESDANSEVGKEIEKRRSDFVHIGDSFATVNFPLNGGEDNLKCLIIHSSGNPAYAVSYKTQKTIEALTGGSKPDIILDNQYHTAEYLPNYRGIDAFQTACFQDQTSFMKAKHAPAHVGGWLIRYSIKRDGDGTVRTIVPTYKAFYGKGKTKKSSIDSIVSLRKTASNISGKLGRLEESYKKASDDGDEAKIGRIKRKLKDIETFQYGLRSEMKSQLQELSSESRVVYSEPVDGNGIIFGILGDSHFGHICDSREYHDDAFEILSKLGVKKVFHAGDVLDGYGMHYGQEFEQYAKGFDEQLGAMIEKYPKFPGIETEFICGNHDLSFTKKNNINVGKIIEMVRPDMHHIGDGVGQFDFVLKNGRKIKVRLEHPSGGSAYALSYKPQKIAESIPHSEKSDIIGLGHYHKMEILPHYRNQQIIQAGCMQDQTPFMKSKALAANTGFYVIKNSYGGYTNMFDILPISFDKSRKFDIDLCIEEAREKFS